MYTLKGVQPLNIGLSGTPSESNHNSIPDNVVGPEGNLPGDYLKQTCVDNGDCGMQSVTVFRSLFLLIMAFRRRFQIYTFYLEKTTTLNSIILDSQPVCTCTNNKGKL